LLALTAVCAALFASFRWLGLGPRASLFVAAILVVAAAGATSLVIAIGRYGMAEGGVPPESAADDDSSASRKA
jgi:hypothetical protein